MEKVILKQLIVYSGLSQKQIAIKSGVAEAQISRYLNRTKPSLATLQKIANVCSCELILQIKKHTKV